MTINLGNASTPASDLQIDGIRQDLRAQHGVGNLTAAGIAAAIASSALRTGATYQPTDAPEDFYLAVAAAIVRKIAHSGNLAALLADIGYGSSYDMATDRKMAGVATPIASLLQAAATVLDRSVKVSLKSPKRVITWVNSGLTWTVSNPGSVAVLTTGASANHGLTTTGRRVLLKFSGNPSLNGWYNVTAVTTVAPYTITTDCPMVSTTGIGTATVGAVGEDLLVENFTFDGPLMGTNGAMDWRIAFDTTSNADNKIMKVFFGGTVSNWIHTPTDVNKFLSGAVNTGETHTLRGSLHMWGSVSANGGAHMNNVNTPGAPQDINANLGVAGVPVAITFRAITAGGYMTYKGHLFQTTYQD